MTQNLTKEIIKQIFFRIGLFSDYVIGFSSGLNKQFLLDKKILFESETGKNIEKNMWGLKATISESKVKILIADSSEEYPEYCIIIQMDNFRPFCIRSSKDPEDFGEINLFIDDKKMIPADILLQTKLLTGVEQLSSICCQWDKLDDYQNLFEYLAKFLA